MCPDDASHGRGWHGALELAFERRGDRSVLAHRRHDGPLVVQKPLYPEGHGICHAIVVHPPAGIAGGDALDIAIEAGERSHALLTTPGAGKWYRSSGSWARQSVRLRVAANACAEWLPQETILYDATRARIEWHAELDEHAHLIAWDIYCLGRTGSGERFERGDASIETRVRCAGRLVWLERARLAPGAPAHDANAGLAGQPVFGTLLASAPALRDGLLEDCRNESPREGEGAITAVPGLIVARYRGASSEAAREYFTAVWKRLRMPIVNAPLIEPRIWRT